MTTVLAERPLAAAITERFDLLACAAEADFASEIRANRGEAVPGEGWELDELTARVMAEQKRIELAERAPARHYWFQGKALNAARRHFRRNHWGNYLKTCGISKDQARSARKLAMFYASAAALDGLSVRAALRLARGGNARDREAARSLRNLATRLRNAVKAVRSIAQTASTSDERAALARSIETAISSLSAIRRGEGKGEKP